MFTAGRNLDLEDQDHAHLCLYMNLANSMLIMSFNLRLEILKIKG